jgi:hypothetical protein
VCPTATIADSAGIAADTRPETAAGPGVPGDAAVADGSGQLAFTGSDVGMWVCLAGVLLILGVALVAGSAEIAKRRR